MSGLGWIFFGSGWIGLDMSLNKFEMDIKEVIKRVFPK